jgi:hypothetical protein
MLRIYHYLLVFQVGPATILEIISTAKVTRVIGGVLRRAVPTMLGVAVYIVIVVISSDSSTIRVVGSILGVSKTDFDSAQFDKKIIHYGLYVFVTPFLVHQIPNPIQRINIYFFHSSEVFKGNSNTFFCVFFV